tara:strand:+ start:831 stop:1022 length:192 start_codon:yes stop_codon:yes gene_type:complete
MMKFLELVLPFAINLISRWLSAADEREETKQRWLDFIENMDHNESRSKKIKNQIEKLREEIFR